MSLPLIPANPYGLSGSRGSEGDALHKGVGNRIDLGEVRIPTHQEGHVQDRSPTRRWREQPAHLDRRWAIRYDLPAGLVPEPKQPDAEYRFAGYETQIQCQRAVYP